MSEVIRLGVKSGVEVSSVLRKLFLWSSLFSILTMFQILLFLGVTFGFGTLSLYIPSAIDLFGSLSALVEALGYFTVIYFLMIPIGIGVAIYFGVVFALKAHLIVESNGFSFFPSVSAGGKKFSYEEISKIRVAPNYCELLLTKKPFKLTINDFSSKKDEAALKTLFQKVPQAKVTDLEFKSLATKSIFTIFLFNIFLFSLLFLAFLKSNFTKVVPDSSFGTFLATKILEYWDQFLLTILIFALPQCIFYLTKVYFYRFRKDPGVEVLK